MSSDVLRRPSFSFMARACLASGRRYGTSSVITTCAGQTLCAWGKIDGRLWIANMPIISASVTCVPSCPMTGPRRLLRLFRTWLICDISTTGLLGDKNALVVWGALSPEALGRKRSPGTLDRALWNASEVCQYGWHIRNR